MHLQLVCIYHSASGEIEICLNIQLCWSAVSYKLLYTIPGKSHAVAFFLGHVAQVHVGPQEQFSPAGIRNTAQRCQNTSHTQDIPQMRRLLNGMQGSWVSKQQIHLMITAGRASNFLQYSGKASWLSDDRIQQCIRKILDAHEMDASSQREAGRNVVPQVQPLAHDAQVSSGLPHVLHLQSAGHWQLAPDQARAASAVQPFKGKPPIQRQVRFYDAGCSQRQDVPVCYHMLQSRPIE
jgi:hypothetical protein